MGGLKVSRRAILHCALPRARLSWSFVFAVALSVGGSSEGLSYLGAHQLSVCVSGKQSSIYVVIQDGLSTKAFSNGRTLSTLECSPLARTFDLLRFFERSAADSGLLRLALE